MNDTKYPERVYVSQDSTNPVVFWRSKNIGDIEYIRTDGELVERMNAVIAAARRLVENNADEVDETQAAIDRLELGTSIVNLDRIKG